MVFLYPKSQVKKEIFLLLLTSSSQKNYHRMQKIFFMICYQTSEIMLMRIFRHCFIYFSICNLKIFLGTFSNIASRYHCRSLQIFQYFLLEISYQLISKKIQNAQADNGITSKYYNKLEEPRN